MTADAAQFGLPEADETFGSYLQRARRFRGLTQRRLAEQLQVDFTYLSKIENGRGDMLSEEKIRAAAEILAVDANTLLALAGKVPPQIRQMALEERDFAMFLREVSELRADERRALEDRDFATFLRQLSELTADERRTLYRKVGRRR